MSKLSKEQIEINEPRIKEVSRLHHMLDETVGKAQAEEIRESVVASIRNGDFYRNYLIAKSGRKVLGLIGIQKPSLESNEPVKVIHTVVADDMQQKGIGGNLLSSALELAANQNYTDAEVKIARENIVGIEFFLQRFDGITDISSSESVVFHKSLEA